MLLNQRHTEESKKKISMSLKRLNLGINKIDVLNTKVNNPCATLQEIGDKYGVTRERIRQILEPYNLPTGRTIKYMTAHVCPICGEPKSLYSKTCIDCAGSINN